MSDPDASIKSIASVHLDRDDLNSCDSLNSDDQQKSSLFVPSPNLSRNSTTSCLSTTATKDGIEGRRIHRQGPNPYSNQIISNMIRRNIDPKSGDNNVALLGNDVTDSFLDSHVKYKSPTGTPSNSNTPIHSPSSLHSPSPSEKLQLQETSSTTSDPAGSEKFNYSQTSIQTTDAQIDGERGPKVNVLGDQPGLSLKAKMSLLNKD